MSAVNTPGLPPQPLSCTSRTADSTWAEPPALPTRREFKRAVRARLGLVLIAAVGFLGIAATPGHADDVVIGFDSWPSTAPPGSTIMVHGSKCGSVIDPWGGGPIEGTVSVQVVGGDGAAVAGHVFYTENTIWGGALNLPESIPHGDYAITAHCVPEQGNEFDYPSNTLTVVPDIGNQTAAPGSNSGYGAAPGSSGSGYSPIAPAPDPLTSAAYSSAGSHTYGIGSWSTNAARLAVATLVLTGLGFPLLLIYRRRKTSKPKIAQDIGNRG